MAEFAFPIDWHGGVLERWRFVSDVSSSWDGTEQRVSLRSSPIVELEGEAYCKGADAASLPAWLEANQGDPFLLPYWPAGEGTAADLTARFLAPVNARWSSPEMVRAQCKAQVEAGYMPPSAAVDQVGGIDRLLVSRRDYAQPITDDWRRLLAILDTQTGPLKVLDRSGYARRRVDLACLFVGAAEIAEGRAFVWRRLGRVRPALMPMPEGGYVLARLDADEIEWRWITPLAVRASLPFLTLPNES